MERRGNGIWRFTVNLDSSNGKCFLGIFLSLTMCLQETPWSRAEMVMVRTFQEPS